MAARDGLAAHLSPSCERRRDWRRGRGFVHDAIPERAQNSRRARMSQPLIGPAQRRARRDVAP